jgi:hypothetical protein
LLNRYLSTLYTVRCRASPSAILGDFLYFASVLQNKLSASTKTQCLLRLYAEFILKSHHLPSTSSCVPVCGSTQGFDLPLIFLCVRRVYLNGSLISELLVILGFHWHDFLRCASVAVTTPGRLTRCPCLDRPNQDRCVQEAVVETIAERAQAVSDTERYPLQTRE